MGWTHIPDFESDLNEPDKSNNPWKRKNPKRPAHISVDMPPDDWLCQKLERLNTVVAEGDPSRAQDSAGLKRDQFIKVPKSQARWYQMYTIKQDGPHRPGKKLFSWHNTEAKLTPSSQGLPRLRPTLLLDHRLDHYHRNILEGGKSVREKTLTSSTAQLASTGALVNCKRKCPGM